MPTAVPRTVSRNVPRTNLWSHARTRLVSFHHHATAAGRCDRVLPLMRHLKECVISLILNHLWLADENLWCGAISDTETLTFGKSDMVPSLTLGQSLMWCHLWNWDNLGCTDISDIWTIWCDAINDIEITMVISDIGTNSDVVCHLWHWENPMLCYLWHMSLTMLISDLIVLMPFQNLVISQFCVISICLLSGVIYEMTLHVYDIVSFCHRLCRWSRHVASCIVKRCKFPIRHRVKNLVTKLINYWIEIQRLNNLVTRF